MSRSSVRSLLAAILIVVLCMPWVMTLAQGDETATVTSFRAPLHAEADARSGTLANLPRGTLLSVNGRDDSGAWLQVTTPDGMSGWVSVVHVLQHGPYRPGEDEPLYTLVDGRADDWARFVHPYTDPTGDSTGSVDITVVRSYLNDGFLYILIEATGNLANAQLVLVDIVTNQDGVYGTYQYALPPRRAGSLFVLTESAGETRDASSVVSARDEAFEIRIPLELLDNPPAVNIVKVSVQEQTAAGLVTTDELEEVMPAVVTLESEPSPNAVVVDERVNLRAAPVSGRILRVLNPGEPLSLIGRNADGSWLAARMDDGSMGWLTARYVQPDVDVMALPELQ
jgi:SH3-like domain-containing protein